MQPAEAHSNSESLETYEVKKTVEELLQCPYWIVDILPSQVPEDSPGQFFSVEEYFLQGDRIEEIKQKHIDLVLKLNCYRDISISDETVVNPLPKHIADEMKKRYLYIMVGKKHDPFGTDSQLLELIRQIASGEGLFVWKPNF